MPICELSTKTEYYLRVLYTGFIAIRAPFFMIISQQELQELTELFEDTAEFYCDDKLVSGQKLWTVLECLAKRGGGVNINWDGRDEELWGDVNPNNISNGDIADIIEMIGMPASDQVARAEYDEYRDERDGSERLADRYGC